MNAVAAREPDRVAALRHLLRLTDQLRAHVLGGRLDAAATVHRERDEALAAFFAESVLAAERTAMVEACSAMLDMDEAVLRRLEIRRAEVLVEIKAGQRQRQATHVYRAQSGDSHGR